jgi:hypothetical protein
MFELAEEILHQVALLVENKIRWSRIDSIRPRRDHYVHRLGLSCIYNRVGVVAFICDEVCPVRCFDKTRGFADIGDVSGRDVKVDRVTQSVHERVDFGGKASARASNTLSLRPPFPPALCFCARTYEASMIDDSWSASAAKMSNTASKTLPAFHRENLLCTVFYGPNRSGRSRHGTPVLAMYKMALMNSR